MIEFYDVLRKELDEKYPFKAGSLYCCTDTNEIFLDSVYSQTRVQVADCGIRVCATLPLAPNSQCLYVVIGTGSIHMYIDGAWMELGSRPQIHIKNILVEANSTLTISDSRVIESDTVTFIPDLSIADLYDEDSFNITCADGSITIESSSDYDIPGTIIVN